MLLCGRPSGEAAEGAAEGPVPAAASSSSAKPSFCSLSPSLALTALQGCLREAAEVEASRKKREAAQRHAPAASAPAAAASATAAAAAAPWIRGSICATLTAAGKTFAPGAAATSEGAATLGSSSSISAAVWPQEKSLLPHAAASIKLYSELKRTLSTDSPVAAGAATVSPASPALLALLPDEMVGELKLRALPSQPLFHTIPPALQQQSLLLSSDNLLAPLHCVSGSTAQTEALAERQHSQLRAQLHSQLPALLALQLDAHQPLAAFWCFQEAAREGIALPAALTTALLKQLAEAKLLVESSAVAEQLLSQQQHHSSSASSSLPAALEPSLAAHLLCLSASLQELQAIEQQLQRNVRAALMDMTLLDAGVLNRFTQERRAARLHGQALASDSTAQEDARDWHPESYRWSRGTDGLIAGAEQSRRGEQDRSSAAASVPAGISEQLEREEERERLQQEEEMERRRRVQESAILRLFDSLAITTPTRPEGERPSMDAAAGAGVGAGGALANSSSSVLQVLSGSATSGTAVDGSKPFPLYHQPLLLALLVPHSSSATSSSGALPHSLRLDITCSSSRVQTALSAEGISSSHATSSLGSRSSAGLLKSGDMCTLFQHSFRGLAGRHQVASLQQVLSADSAATSSLSSSFYSSDGSSIRAPSLPPVAAVFAASESAAALASYLGHSSTGCGEPSAEAVTAAQEVRAAAGTLTAAEEKLLFQTLLKDCLGRSMRLQRAVSRLQAAVLQDVGRQLSVLAQLHEGGKGDAGRKAPSWQPETFHALTSLAAVSGDRVALAAAALHGYQLLRGADSSGHQQQQWPSQQQHHYKQQQEHHLTGQHQHPVSSEEQAQLRELLSLAVVQLSSLVPAARQRTDKWLEEQASSADIRRMLAVEEEKRQAVGEGESAGSSAGGAAYGWKGHRTTKVVPSHASSASVPMASLPSAASTHSHSAEAGKQEDSSAIAAAAPDILQRMLIAVSAYENFRGSKQQAGQEVKNQLSALLRRLLLTGLTEGPAASRGVTNGLPTAEAAETAAAEAGSKETTPSSTAEWQTAFPVSLPRLPLQSMVQGQRRSRSSSSGPSAHSRSWRLASESLQQQEKDLDREGSAAYEGGSRGGPAAVAGGRGGRGGAGGGKQSPVHWLLHNYILAFAERSRTPPTSTSSLAATEASSGAARGTSAAAGGADVGEGPGVMAVQSHRQSWQLEALEAAKCFHKLLHFEPVPNRGGPEPATSNSTSPHVGQASSVTPPGTAAADHPAVLQALLMASSRQNRWKTLQQTLLAMRKSGGLPLSAH